MSRKTVIMTGMIFGSSLGGYLPTLLGADFISFWSLIGSVVGGLIGIYVSYRLSG